MSSMNAMGGQSESFIQGYGRSQQEFELWKQLVKTFFRVLLQIFEIAALIPQVFLHHRLGQRYLSIPRLIVVYFVLGHLSYVEGLEGLGNVIGIHFGFAVWHSAVAYTRRTRGHLWHSRSPGVPWLGDLLACTSIRNVRFTSPYELATVLEPFLVITVGVLVGPLSPLSVVLYVGAAGIWLRELVAAYQMRCQVWDMTDQKIEQECLQGALEAAPPAETQGFVVPGAARMSKKERELINGLRTPVTPAVADLLQRGVAARARRHEQAAGEEARTESPDKAPAPGDAGKHGKPGAASDETGVSETPTESPASDHKDGKNAEDPKNPNAGGPPSHDNEEAGPQEENDYDEDDREE